jgi:hypothetical protein
MLASAVVAGWLDDDVAPPEDTLAANPVALTLADAWLVRPRKDGAVAGRATGLVAMQPLSEAPHTTRLVMTERFVCGGLGRRASFQCASRARRCRSRAGCGIAFGLPDDPTLDVDTVPGRFGPRACVRRADF